MALVLYAYHSPPDDINVQSGRPFSIFEKLRKDHEVLVCCYGGLIFQFISGLERFLGYVFGQHQMRGRGPISSRYIAFCIKRTLYLNKHRRIDFLFSPTSLTYSRHLNLDLMSVCCVDSLVPGIKEFYPSYDRRCYRKDRKREIEALAAIDILCVPSVWAEAQAKNLGFRGVIVVAPFGYNFAEEVDFRHGRSESDNICHSKPLHLVTIMADWTRKGGDLIHGLTDMLAEDGIDVKISIIGSCKGAPAKLKADTRYNFIGRLDKSSGADWQKFTEIFKSADYFVMPSKGEAYGMAVPEAYAFGLPVIVSRHGGISEFLRRDQRVTLELSEEADLQSVLAEISCRQIDSDRRSGDQERAYYLAQNVYNWDVFYSKMMTAVNRNGRGENGHVG